MPATLALTLTDAAGNDIKDRVTVDLFSARTSNHLQVSERVERDMLIEGIDVSGGPLHRVMVTPANHRIVQFFIILAEGKSTPFSLPVPVDPGKVVSINASSFENLHPRAQQVMEAAQVPRFSDEKRGYLTGLNLYTALNPYPLLKACYLNIVAKSAATPLPDGQTCLDHYSSLLRIEQDRIFLRTTAALVEETAHSNLFHPASAALHDPLPGYSIVSSFKTFDHYGNLQLTFQRQGNTGNEYAADIDIDDAQGIEHIFQVLRNSIAGPTNPYDIHDILLQQKPLVNPNYEFVFAAAGTATATYS